MEDFVENYLPEEIEIKWQKQWKKDQLFKADKKSDKEKRYVLSMFPYPSGALHMGHVMNYTISDVIVRFSIMQGYSVMSTIGWDSFGLPAENAAIRQKIHPSENIRINIEKMKAQMDRAGWGFDWDREFATSSEEYYRWTQWIFLKFYKAGLVEQKKAPVNWCSDCQTVLANEQVHDGNCERCGTIVEQKDLTQWFFLMSKFSEKLLDGHNELGKWPSRVIKMQQEWIGRSEGAFVNFKLEESNELLKVFTTRPDTLFGVTFMSMAPQHPMVETLVEGNTQYDAIMAKVKDMRAQGTSELEILNREKEGVFTGKYAINPVNGEKIPVYIANFVLMNYGTGIVMAVPAHDQRDFEFAKKYNISIKVVITPKDKNLLVSEMDSAFVDDGNMVESGDFSGRNNREAMPDLISWLDTNGFGEKTINYRLRDWLLSRQRYWGAPIPIVFCEKCGTVPIPEDQLPVKLPGNVEFKPSGESPLAVCEEFMNTTCPKCGGDARRESDTMDTFVDSSWYYLRYASPKCTDAPFNKDDVDYWCPVDIYIGGIEHATMHLIYFRFFAQVMNQLGMVDFREPAKKLFCQGMVCKTAHYCETHKWLEEEQVVDGVCSLCGSDVRSEVTKMSKTKLNVISPNAIINRFGADTMRMYILADNPPDRDQVWSDDGVQGVSRFINRLWDTCSNALETLSSKSVAGDSDKKMRLIAHQTLKNCTHVFEETWQFNTAIARVMELLNALRKNYQSLSNDVLEETLGILIKIIAPIIPHVAEELWGKLGHADSVFQSPIPKVDEDALSLDTITIVVQVNGKLRGNFEVAPDAPKEELEKMALAIEKVQKHIEGKTIRKTIVIPRKLVNIVVN